MAAGSGGRDGRRSGTGKVDDGVGVSAPAWWRRTAVDGVADGGGRRRVGWRGCFGAHGVRMGKREVERKGGTM